MSIIGNLKQSENSEKAKLLRSIDRIEKDRKVNFYDIAVQKALFGIDGNTVLNKIIQKLIPDEMKSENKSEIETKVKWMDKE